MAYVTSPLGLAKILKAIIEASQNTWALQAVYLGDQERIPFSPTICVEPGPKTRELAGVPRRTNTLLTVYVLIYHGEISDGRDVMDKNQTLVESVVAALDADDTQGDKLVHGYCSEIAPGYVKKTGKLMQGTRITYTGVIREQLPF